MIKIIGGVIILLLLLIFFLPIILSFLLPFLLKLHLKKIHKKAMKEYKGMYYNFEKVNQSNDPEDVEYEEIPVESSK